MTSRAKTPSRLLLTVAFAISAMLLGIIGAVAAGTGTVTPPPKIAFVTTNANVAPDALTVGPMAGRLGAPLFITNGDNLGEDTKDALVAYGADLIIVAGGPNTVTNDVLDAISTATGLTIKDIADTPSSGIVRVSGDGRDQTAVALSTLIAKYNPKFLPTDATAADSDLLDGKDSTEFLGATAQAADADKLDGMDAGAFAGGVETAQLRWDGTAVTIDSGTDTEILSISFAAPDPCGGGTTTNHYLARGDGHSEGTAGSGEQRVAINLDSTAIAFDETNRIYSADSAATASRSSVWATTKSFDAAPGAHTVYLMGDGFNGSLDVDVEAAVLTLQHVGWTC